MVIPVAQHIRKMASGNHYPVPLPLPWKLTQMSTSLGRRPRYELTLTDSFCFEITLLKEKWQLERKPGGKSLAPTGEMYCVKHVLLLFSQTGMQPVPPLCGHGMRHGACAFPAPCPSHHYSCQPRFTVIRYIDLVMSAWQQRAEKVSRQLILDWSKFIESMWQDPKENIHLFFWNGKTLKPPLIWILWSFSRWWADFLL